MRKMIALMAALGLVTTAAAYAADTTNGSADVNTPAASGDVKADTTANPATATKAEAKTQAKKDSKYKPAAGTHKHKHKKAAEENSTQQ